MTRNQLLEPRQIANRGGRGTCEAHVIMAAIALIVASIDVVLSADDRHGIRFKESSARLEHLSTSMPIKSVNDFPAYITQKGGLPKSQLALFSRSLRTCVQASQPDLELETTRYMQMRALLSVRDLLEACDKEGVIGFGAALKKLCAAAAELQSRGLCNVLAWYGAETAVDRWYKAAKRNKEKALLLPFAGSDHRSDDHSPGIHAAGDSRGAAQEAAAEALPLMGPLHDVTWNHDHDGGLRLRQVTCAPEAV